MPRSPVPARVQANRRGLATGAVDYAEGLEGNGLVGGIGDGLGGTERGDQAVGSGAARRVTAPCRIEVRASAFIALPPLCARFARRTRSW